MYVHSEIEIVFNRSDSTKRIICIFGKTQQQSTSYYQHNKEVNLDTDMIIKDDVVERHKTAATVTLNGRGMDFSRVDERDL